MNRTSSIACAGIVAAAASIVVPLAASAADMPIYKAPPAPVYAFSWSGCYIGGNVGSLRGRDQAHLAPAGTYLTPAGAVSPPNATGTGLLAGDLVSGTHDVSDSHSSVLGGAQVGCNWQSGALVFGGEADIDFGGHAHTVVASFPGVAGANPAFPVSAETARFSAGPTWFSTIRARAGFALDRWYIYGTGGVVVARVSSTTNVTFAPTAGTNVFDSSVQTGSFTETRTRGVVGGGVEYAFGNNWSFKGEALFFNLGTVNYNSPLVSPAGLASGYSWSTSVRLRETILRAGLNYKFN